MKALYLDWNAYAGEYVKKAIENYGHELVLFDFPASDAPKNNEEVSTKIATKIITEKIDYVFSLNYFPVAAIACKACGVKYISWTYDSPYVLLYSDTINFETNYAFIFDRAEVMNLKSLGVSTVYYMPMAAPARVYTEMTAAVNTQKAPTVRNRDFTADIAMIGSMYTEKKHRLMEKFAGASDYTRGYLEALVESQKFLYGTDIIEPALSARVMTELMEKAPMLMPEDEFKKPEWVYSKYFLLREVTRRERHECLDLISQHVKTTLYTHEPTPDLPRVDNRGPVDYYNEMPLAMKGAKINLNISLRSIVSGIPLRAWDIFGAGGFLLTNYQADFTDFFTPGEDYVYFENPEDLAEKAEYYLSHESERMGIAMAGHEKVMKLHTYDARFSEIMLTVFGE